MRVGDLMQSEVVSAQLDTPVQVAYQLMRDGGFRHLPVLDGQGKLVGVVSDRDLRGVGAIYEDADSGLNELLVTEEVTVDKIMSTRPITVSPDTSVTTAVKLIKEKRIGCLIVTQGEKLVGILSYLDVLDAALAAFPAAAQSAQESGELRPLSQRELKDLREQMTKELSEFRAQHTVSKRTDVDPKR